MIVQGTIKPKKGPLLTHANMGGAFNEKNLKITEHLKNLKTSLQNNKRIHIHNKST